MLVLVTMQACHSGWMVIKIHGIHHLALMSTPLYEVGEVFERIVALLANLDRLIAASTKLLNGLFEIDLQVVGRDLQHLADLARDAAAVGVDVVQGCKLNRNLLAQPMRKGMGNLV